MGGVSGAVLILPFQVSVLGFVGPAVSPTNLLFNIFATPSGVLRYIRDHRMVWPLAWITVIGTAPGILLGAFVRTHFLPDPRVFKLFAGLVLSYIGIRLVYDILRKGTPQSSTRNEFKVSEISLSFLKLSYRFNDVLYEIVVAKLLILSILVGLVSGIYGIGGGSLIAPFLVTLFALPVHSIAGVTLFGTFLSSIVGVLSYFLISIFAVKSGAPIAPDWLLGGLFGLGGAGGMYVGARVQRHVPARVIKSILAVMVLFVAVKYIFDFFR